MNERFTYRETKDGRVHIAYAGGTVTVLAGKAASRFLDRVRDQSIETQQMVMAKATGHFKHGNEREAKYRRNRQ